jgi:HEAT repeat protein
MPSPHNSNTQEIFMRRLLASFLFVGSLASLVQLGLGQTAADVAPGNHPKHESAGTYRGKPLSFYEAKAKSPDQRADALRAIGSFGTDAATALPQLVNGLQDSDDQVKMAAAWAISQIGPSANLSAVKALEQTLSDSNPRVRSLAAVALKGIGLRAVDAVPQLITALNDPIAFVRAPAADALGAIGPAAHDAIDPLAKRLGTNGEQIFVLRSICYALGNIGPEARPAIPALEEAFKQVRVSYAAQSAILKIKQEPVPSY